MRQVTATEKYRAVNEGKMAKNEFVRQMRLAHPSMISQYSGYNDTVQILKNRGYISEKTGLDSYDSRRDLNISLESIDRGIRYELSGRGIDPTDALANRDDEMLSKIEDTVLKNLKKDPLHYINLLAKESSHVDKHDKMKETKRGAEDVDTFNALKNATLKEGYTEEQIEAAVQRIKERKAGEHEDGTPKSNDEMGDDEREDFYNDLDSVEEVEKVDVVKEAGRTALIQTMNNAIAAIKGKYGEMPGIAGIIRDFLMTHLDDLADGADPLDEFENYVDANYDSLSEEVMCPHCGMTKADCKCNHVEEKKGKDHDGDGDIDSDDYMAAKDKAIKKAMSEEVQIKEAVKTLIRKALTEESINEAATGNLSKFSDDYADFAGMTQIINQLENLVTDVEGFYAKTGEKLQKIFDAVGNVTNEEGLKVGGFIAPAIESAFKKDIQPVVKRGFMNAVQIPTIKQISSADIDRMRADQGMAEEEMEEKQTMFTPVMETKKK